MISRSHKCQLAPHESPVDTVNFTIGSIHENPPLEVTRASFHVLHLGLETNNGLTSSKGNGCPGSDGVISMGPNVEYGDGLQWWWEKGLE